MHFVNHKRTKEVTKHMPVQKNEKMIIKKYGGRSLERDSRDAF